MEDILASKGLVCQAALTAKGGLKDAHFMRYVAFTFSSLRVIGWSVTMVFGFAVWSRLKNANTVL